MKGPWDMSKMFSILWLFSLIVMEYGLCSVMAIIAECYLGARSRYCDLAISRLVIDLKRTPIRLSTRITVTGQISYQGDVPYKKHLNTWSEYYNGTLKD